MTIFQDFEDNKAYLQTITGFVEGLTSQAKYAHTTHTEKDIPHPSPPYTPHSTVRFLLDYVVNFVVGGREEGTFGVNSLCVPTAVVD